MTLLGVAAACLLLPACCAAAADCAAGRQRSKSKVSSRQVCSPRLLKVNLSLKVPRVGMKRNCSPCEENLDCCVCLELLEDATQVRCCGAKFCRNCIIQSVAVNPICPHCRSPCVINACVVDDPGAERKSAAKLRPCVYDVEGCMFVGKRADCKTHEQSCDRTPFTVMKQRNTALLQRNQDLLLQNNSLVRTINQERDAAHAERLMLIADMSEKRQALMKAALGTEPAENALMLLHSEDPEKGGIKKVCRALCKGQAYTVPGWLGCQSISIVINESNYNVSLSFVKDSNAADKFPDGFPELSLELHLLHPFDKDRVKYFQIQATDLNRSNSSVFSNVMTSREFDEYCVNGYFYLA